VAPCVHAPPLRRRFVHTARRRLGRGYRWPVVWTRIVPGAALVLAVVAGAVKSGDAVVAGHWAYAVWLAVAALAGAGWLWWGVKGPATRPGRAA